MNKWITYFILAPLIFVGFLFSACSDGSHRRAGILGVPQSGSQVVDADVAAVSMVCVDVVGYRKFEATETEPEPDPEQTEEVTEGDTVKAQVSATEAMQELTGIDYLIANSSTPSKQLRDCIKNAINSMRASGSEYYMGNVTWIVTRDKISKIPKPETITYDDFLSCSQVQEATCLFFD